jgi:isopentenyl diphosphate isomerase/L-lactate dehydrogenase-like FMN-dependent dehydrogenase
LTADDDINISLIERAKQAGVFAIMVTIDAGAAHGGIPMIATGSDITFSTHISGNILSDVVFNIKCFEKLGCIGTMDKAIITYISERSKTSAEQIRSTYNKKKAFQFARRLQIGGMSKQYSCLDSAAAEYIWSLDHLAKICHSAQSMSKYVKYNFAKGVPIIAKGILSTRDAKAAIDCDVDCLYVSNHGGRFLQNSIAPIDALPAIKSVAEGVNPNIGVWFDSGVRNAGDILVAYSRGADFVGIGRPVIYSCVVYGGIGVEAILKQLLFFLKQQCILCGVNNLDQAKDICA